MVERLEQQRRGGAGQVQHAGVRGRRQHLQRGVRRDAKSLEAVAHLRRLLGRLGGCPGQRPGVAGHRIGSGRQPAHAGWLLRRGGPAAKPGQGRRRPLAAAFDTLSVEGPMARYGGRRGADAGRMAGVHAEDPLSLAEPPRPFAEAAARPRAAGPGRLQRRPRHHPGCVRGARGMRRGGAPPGGRRRRASRRPSPTCRRRRRRSRCCGRPDSWPAWSELYRRPPRPAEAGLIWNIEQGMALSPPSGSDGPSAPAARSSSGSARSSIAIRCCSARPPAWHRSTYPSAGCPSWRGCASTTTSNGCASLPRSRSAPARSWRCPAALPATVCRSGMQLVGRVRGEWELLSAAAAIEQVWGMAGLVPLAAGSEAVSSVVGRFAPSPSGPMHLGNARTALLAWLDARSRGGRMVLRIKDLDRDRCRAEFAQRSGTTSPGWGSTADEETAPSRTASPPTVRRCSSWKTRACCMSASAAAASWRWRPRPTAPVMSRRPTRARAAR